MIRRDAKEMRIPLRHHRRFRLRAALPLAGAAVAAGTAICFALDRPPPPARETVVIRTVSEDDIVLVPTPARPVVRGESLAGVPLTDVKWPKSRVSGEYVADRTLLSGTYAAQALPKLVPIPMSALRSEPLETNHVVDGIPQSMRAITVRVDAESAVEGWARSGSFVDVILVRTVERGGDALPEAQVIAENIRILSADRSATDDGSDGLPSAPPTTVTLLTSQEDALRIKSAVTLGRLAFALRGGGDRGPTLSRSLDGRALVGVPRRTSDADEARRGFARSPDGQVFVLASHGRWARLLDDHHPFAAAKSPQDKHGAVSRSGEEAQ